MKSYIYSENFIWLKYDKDIFWKLIQMLWGKNDHNWVYLKRTEFCCYNGILSKLLFNQLCLRNGFKID